MPGRATVASRHASRRSVTLVPSRQPTTSMFHRPSQASSAVMDAPLTPVFASAPSAGRRGCGDRPRSVSAHSVPRRAGCLLAHSGRIGRILPSISPFSAVTDLSQARNGRWRGPFSRDAGSARVGRLVDPAGAATAPSRPRVSTARAPRGQAATRYQRPDSASADRSVRTRSLATRGGPSSAAQAAFMLFGIGCQTRARRAASPVVPAWGGLVD